MLSHAPMERQIGRDVVFDLVDHWRVKHVRLRMNETLHASRHKIQEQLKLDGASGSQQIIPMR